MKLILGIRRHIKRFLLAIVFGFTTLWTVLEPIFALLDIKTSEYSCFYLAGYFIISLIIAIIVVYPKKKVKFGLTNTNTKVEIEFGDIFRTPGHKVISASEFFDSKIGKPVSPTSLHGIFINKILGGHVSIFDNTVNSQLAGQQIDTVQRVDGKTLNF